MPRPPLMLPPNADLAEVVELGIHEQVIQERCVSAITAFQGLEVNPPVEWLPLMAYVSELEEAAKHADELASAATRLAVHLRRRAVAIIDQADGPTREEARMA